MATEPHTFDLVVLGAGSGGYAAALRASQLGLSVALVEADRIGGTCLHVGCIPTKALLHAGHVADNIRHAGTVGIHAELTGIDAAALTAHKDAVVAKLYRGLQSLVSGAGIEVVTGQGVLEDARTVRVGDTMLRGRHLLLATGATPRLLPGITPSDRVLTSDGALALDRIPASVLVLGGGTIGVEFASLWRSLGSEVTILEVQDRLIPTEEPVLSGGLRRAFTKRGITVRTGVSLTEVLEESDAVTVRLTGGEELTAEVLLVSVGRRPRTEGLGLEHAGVELRDGFVQTDERLRTSVEHIMAVGDVVRGLQLAHRGFAHGIFAAEQIAGREPEPVSDANVPRITYSDPEVASVGLTEEAARHLHGEAVQTVTYDLGGNARTQILGGRGLVKLVRAADGPILGAHLIGPGVGELIGEAQLIVGWQAYAEDVAPHLHAHPTQNESLGEAALALAGQPLHVHP